jgi:hypothetical protein
MDGHAGGSSEKGTEMETVGGRSIADGSNC